MYKVYIFRASLADSDDSPAVTEQLAYAINDWLASEGGRFTEVTTSMVVIENSGPANAIIATVTYKETTP